MRVLALHKFALPYTDRGPLTPPGRLPLLDLWAWHAMAWHPLYRTWPRHLRWRSWGLLHERL